MRGHVSIGNLQNMGPYKKSSPNWVLVPQAWFPQLFQPGGITSLTTPWTQPFFIDVLCSAGKWHIGDVCLTLLHVLGGRQYQGIQLAESFKWEHFSFLPFPKTFPPALGHLLGIIREVPHNQSFRCKGLLNYQLRRCQTASAERKLQSHP